MLRSLYSDCGLFDVTVIKYDNYDTDLKSRMNIVQYTYKNKNYISDTFDSVRYKMYLFL